MDSMSLSIVMHLKGFIDINYSMCKRIKKELKGSFFHQGNLVCCTSFKKHQESIHNYSPYENLLYHEYVDVNLEGQARLEEM